MISALQFESACISSFQVVLIHRSRSLTSSSRSESYPNRTELRNIIPSLSKTRSGGLQHHEIGTWSQLEGWSPWKPLDLKEEMSAGVLLVLCPHQLSNFRWRNFRFPGKARQLSLATTTSPYCQKCGNPTSKQVRASVYIYTWTCSNSTCPDMVSHVADINHYDSMTMNRVNWQSPTLWLLHQTDSVGTFTKLVSG